MARETADDDLKRIDEDPNAETEDTRLRVEAGDHGTYELRRERYRLVEFEPAFEADDGQGFERYDWHPEETFVLHGSPEAKQFAGMVADAGALDPTILFFRQFSPDDLDLEPVRHRIEQAMDALGDDDRADAERQLQHAHAKIGGEKDDLFPDDGGESPQ